MGEFVPPRPRPRLLTDREPVQRGQERLREAAKLGFTHAIIPSANKPKHAIEGLTIVAVDRLVQAVDYLKK